MRESQRVAPSGGKSDGKNPKEPEEVELSKIEENEHAADLANGNEEEGKENR